MLDLFKQYIQETTGKKTIVSGDAFFLTYTVLEDECVFIDFMFVNEKLRAKDKLTTIYTRILESFNNLGISKGVLFSVFLGSSYAVEQIAALSELGYIQDSCDGVNIILK
jgi:hypothetical protein